MSNSILDLVPGTIWKQNITRTNKALIIIKIEYGLFCKILPSYGIDNRGNPITTAEADNSEVIKMIHYDREPRIVYRYLICESKRHIDRLSISYASSIICSYTRIDK